MKRLLTAAMFSFIAIFLSATAGAVADAQFSPVVVTVMADKPAYAVGEEVRFTLQVRNAGPAPVIVTRPTAQAFDFVVRHAGQRPVAAIADQVWAWSDNRVFAAVAEQMLMEPGRTLTFSETWDQRDRNGNPVGPGAYTVQGIFITDQNIQPAVTSFTMGQSVPSPERVTVRLNSIAGSGVRGSATLTAQNGGTQVVIDVTGLRAGLIAETRLHAGTCTQLSFSAARLPDLRADASGRARAAGAVLFRGSQPVALPTILDGAHVIMISLRGRPVACGTIPDAPVPTDAAAASLYPVGNSGVRGAAILTAEGTGTHVALDVRGLPTGATAEVRLHSGTCGQASFSAVHLPDLRADASGRARASGQVQFRGREPVALAALLDGAHVITIHLPERVVACGPIQAIGALR